MTRDHKIRVMVSFAPNARVRERWILHFLVYPKSVNREFAYYAQRHSRAWRYRSSNA